MEQAPPEWRGDSNARIDVGETHRHDNRCLRNNQLHDHTKGLTVKLTCRGRCNDDVPREM